MRIKFAGLVTQKEMIYKDSQTSNYADDDINMIIYHTMN
jgi:hypothetical protein